MPEPCQALIYISKSAHRLTQSDLTDLLAQSRKRNLETAITGLLLYSGGNFMQLIEGSQEGIERLMIRIKRDTRHYDVQVLEDGPVPHRSFSGWSMAFLDFASPQVRALPGYSEFLEGPLVIDEGVDAATRNVRLLHYFKAVMTATDASVLDLVQSAERPVVDSP